MRAIGRIRLRRKHILPICLAPFVLWVLAIELMPTGWIVHRLQDSIERVTGLDAKVDRLRLTLGGNLVIQNMRLGQNDPESEESTSIQVSKVNVNVDWFSVLCGRLAMTDIQIIGLDGVLTREADGSWLPDRWLNPIQQTEQKWASGKVRSWLIDVEIYGGRLVIKDPQHKTRVLLTGINGMAETGEGYFKLPELRAKVDGGELVLAVSADRSQEIPIFDTNLVMRNVPLGVHFDVLGFVCPLLAGEDSSPRGRLDLEIYVQGRLEQNWTDSLKGRGMLKLDPVSVAGLPVVQKIGLDTLAAEIDGRERTLEDLTIRITNPFTIQDRRVLSPSMRVEVGPVPLKFEGWTDFDGQLDYAMRTDVIRDQLPAGMRGVLDDLKPQDEALAIRGNLNQVTILVNDQPITTDRYRIRKTDLRNEVEQISKRLSERLMR